MESDRPLFGPARYLLDGFQRVTVGRGPERVVSVHGEQLRIEVPDEAISSAHAEILRVESEWRLRDLGSRNGTFVDSRRVEEDILEDGARLRLGGTFFTFRRSYQNDGPPLLESKDLPLGAVGVRTISPSMQQVLRRLEAVAPARVPVLLLGESGTGKELLARALHLLSGRSGDFVAVNCGAIPQNLVEAELFGYRRGAFSGADREHPGLVRASSRGTLFLDEVGDLPIQAQSALLRVLQESEVLQVGSVRPERLDLRVVAATHRNLEELAKQKTFRHDLLARLDGITLVVPPVRERLEDVPLLVATLIGRLAPGRDISLAPEVAEVLLNHDWPLNVREIENVLAAALALSGGGAIELEHLPRSLVEGPPAPRDLSSSEAAHREQLVLLLREHRGNLNAVARVLGKGRTQVARWVSRYGLHLSAFRRQ
jgi:transcriptional regulator with PAS, ATPase and Fis domain